MRRTQARQCELTLGEDCRIEEQRCHVCRRFLTHGAPEYIDVSKPPPDNPLPPGECQVFVLGANENGAVELAFCSRTCVLAGGAFRELERRAERRRQPKSLRAASADASAPGASPAVQRQHVQRRARDASPEADTLR